MRDDLIAFAQGFIDNWNRYGDRETKSNQYGFQFVARQTEYEGHVMTVTKAFIPGCTIEHHARYREKYSELTP